MTNGVKISELNSAASLDGTETMPVVQAGATVKATAAQITTLAQTNVPAANITGTLPVAHGGTGTTTSTGTGSTVLSNSPALVTPNLGTPSAAVLTNATGLPLTTGVTGTLPIGNGGTNATAAIDAVVNLSAEHIVTTLAALKALTARPASVMNQYRSTAGDGGGGVWVWRSGDQSANVTADTQSGLWAAPNSDSTGASGAWQRQYSGAADVRWFGAKADWTSGTSGTDNAAVFTAAFAAVTDLYVPPGDYMLLSCPTAPAGAFHLHGKPGLSRLVITHGGTRALYFTPASLGNQVVIEKLVLLANYASGPTPLGIDIVYPSSSSFPFNTATIRDVKFESNLSNTTTPWAATWGRGIKLTNAWYALIERVTGYSSYIAADTGNTGFLEIAGGSYGSVGLRTINNIWYNGADGIRMSAYTEGLVCSGDEYVNVNRGLYLPSSTPVGGASGTLRALAIYLSDVIAAAHTDGLSLDTMNSLKAIGCDIGRQTGSTQNWTGFRLANVNYSHIESGRIAGNSGSGTATGIAATGSNSANTIVTGNAFENLDTQFTLAAATSRWTITDNWSSGSTPDVFTIDGTLHSVVWKNATNTVTHYANTTTSLSLGPSGTLSMPATLGYQLGGYNALRDNGSYTVVLGHQGSNESLLLSSSASYFSADTITLRNAATTTTYATFSSSGLTLSGTLTYAGVTAANSVTGTGSLVLATSPTLTTPNLGTPSAATLTNATGLPVSTGISGLGTNVATFLATPSSANLAAAITDETGSGALVFATSPTLATPQIGVAKGTSLALGEAAITQSGSAFEVYSSAASLQIVADLKNDSNGSGVVALGLNVSSVAGGETSVSKGGIGMVRNNAQGVGDLVLYSRASTDTSSFTTSDGVLRYVTASTRWVFGPSASSSYPAIALPSGTDMYLVNGDGSAFINLLLGRSNLQPMTAPSSPSAGWTLYVDSGDSNKLKAKASNGTVVTLGTP